MPTDYDWTKPAAMAIPKEGYFKLEHGRYGPTYPKSPSCHGFSVVGKVKPGREQAIRDYGKSIEEAVKATPDVLALPVHDPARPDSRFVRAPPLQLSWNLPLTFPSARSMRSQVWTS